MTNPPAGAMETREAIARIIDPKAWATVREIAAAEGLDAANPPTGVVIFEDIDSLRPKREAARLESLAKAGTILALTADRLSLLTRLESEAGGLLREFAQQPLPEELSSANRKAADFEGAYAIAIKRAREALKLPPEQLRWALSEIDRLTRLVAEGEEALGPFADQPKLLEHYANTSPDHKPSIFASDMGLTVQDFRRAVEVRQRMKS